MKVLINENKVTMEKEICIVINPNTSKGCMRTIILLHFLLKEDKAFPFDTEARKKIDEAYLDAIRNYPKLLAPD
jgi:hypothetical protein